ncbi:microtubule-associated protein RP/EB family member 1A-like [Miscanthus floridulus]|uniref:microtubule-associated protein RP/EB family member 1A-like n=1 Tax=Miscanthus floridulus TaxID=154761 RepID=UPI003459A339
MDAAHPGAVPMHKGNFDAKMEYDMIQNYKVLQDVFNKLKITKPTKDIQKICRGRPCFTLEGQASIHVSAQKYICSIALMVFQQLGGNGP